MQVANDDETEIPLPVQRVLISNAVTDLAEMFAAKGLQPKVVADAMVGGSLAVCVAARGIKSTVAELRRAANFLENHENAVDRIRKSGMQ